MKIKNEVEEDGYSVRRNDSNGIVSDDLASFPPQRRIEQILGCGHNKGELDDHIANGTTNEIDPETIKSSRDDSRGEEVSEASSLIDNKEDYAPPSTKVTEKNITFTRLGGATRDRESAGGSRDIGYISLDPAYQRQAGLDIMWWIFKLVDQRGYWTDCFCHGNKTRFLESVNDKLFADDGPLKHLKKLSAKTFQTKVMKSIDEIDRICSMSKNYGGSGGGKEYPVHLKDIIVKYQEIKRNAFGDLNLSISGNPDHCINGYASESTITEHKKDESHDADTKRHGNDQDNTGAQIEWKESTRTEEYAGTSSNNNQALGSKKRRMEKMSVDTDINNATDSMGRKEMREQETDFNTDEGSSICAKRRRTVENNGTHEIAQGRIEIKEDAEEANMTSEGSFRDEEKKCEKQKVDENQWKREEIVLKMEENKLTVAKEEAKLKIESARLNLQIAKHDALTKWINQTRHILPHYAKHDDEEMRAILLSSMMDMMRKQSSIANNL